MITARTIAAPACAVLFLAAGCAPAMDPGPAAQPAPGVAMAAHADMWATTAGAFEGGVAGARFALDRTRDPAVRTYAQRLVDDYGAAGQRFTGLLRQHQIDHTPGTGAQRLQDTQRQAMEAFRGYEGQDFDRRWIDHQVATHQWMLDTIDRSYLPAAAGRPELEAELRTQREMIQRHLQEAERIRGGWRQ